MKPKEQRYTEAVERNLQAALLEMERCRWRNTENPYTGMKRAKAMTRLGIRKGETDGHILSRVDVLTGQRPLDQVDDQQENKCSTKHGREET